MGQKANPNALRYGINKDWNSRWYAPNNQLWSTWTIQDKKIRKYFDTKTKKWLLSNIEIDRTESAIRVTINTVKPGMVLGQESKNLKIIRKEISKIIRDRKLDLDVKVKEVINPEIDAKIVANEIAIALENRASFRIVQKRAISKVMRFGAKGIKTQVSGRLNGVDMARTEGYSEGVVPQQTFRNDLDFAVAEAHTTYGVLGVKVWISRGDLLKGQKRINIKRPTRDDRNSNWKNKNFNKQNKSNQNQQKRGESK